MEQMNSFLRAIVDGTPSGTPNTRFDMYLASLAGESITLPPPTNEIERQVYTIAKNGTFGPADEDPVERVLEVTENGTYDVTKYTSANVQEPPSAYKGKTLTAHCSFYITTDYTAWSTDEYIRVSRGGLLDSSGNMRTDYKRVNLRNLPASVYSDDIVAYTTFLGEHVGLLIQAVCPNTRYATLQMSVSAQDERTIVESVYKNNNNDEAFVIFKPSSEGISYVGINVNINVARSS